MTGTLWHLAAAIMVFLASHSLAVSPAIRRPAERRLGRAGFALAYSVVSVLLLTWAVAAYGDAPSWVVWEQRPWMRWAPPLAMLPACVLLAAGLSTPNPFSIGPGGRGFDPARPGLLRLTRHPVLWGLALWAGAHALANGDVAALMLFLPLLFLALAGPRLLDARRRAAMGEEAWAEAARHTGRFRPDMFAEMGWRRPALGLLLYASLFALHQPVIGISPVP